MDKTTNTLLTAQEVAAKLKLSPRTIQDLVNKGQLRAIRVGSRLRIYSDDLDAYLESQVVVPVGHGRRVIASRSYSMRDQLKTLKAA